MTATSWPFRAASRSLSSGTVLFDSSGVAAERFVGRCLGMGGASTTEDSKVNVTPFRLTLSGKRLSTPARRDAALVARTFDFYGHPVTVVQWDGRVWWVASQVGDASDYADGRRLVAKVRDEWRHDLLDGRASACSWATTCGRSDARRMTAQPGRIGRPTPRVGSRPPPGGLAGGRRGAISAPTDYCIT